MSTETANPNSLGKDGASVHDLLEQKAADVTQQIQQCDAELRAARARVAYLEQMLLRCDGALTVLRQLLDEPPPPAPAPASNSHMPEPVAS